MRSRGKRPTACAAALLLLISGCSEQRRERFASGADALTSHAVRRGWIPAWLPPGATDVDLRYNLDTNDVWLSFRLDRTAAAALQRELMPLDDRRVRSLDLRMPRGNAGWPEGLIQQQPANDAALNARVFRGAGTRIPQSTCIAFEQTTDRVYAWIPYEATRR